MSQVEGHVVTQAGGGHVLTHESHESAGHGGTHGAHEPSGHAIISHMPHNPAAGHAAHVSHEPAEPHEKKQCVHGIPGIQVVGLQHEGMQMQGIHVVAVQQEGMQGMNAAATHQEGMQGFQTIALPEGIQALALPAGAPVPAPHQLQPALIQATLQPSAPTCKCGGHRVCGPGGLGGGGARMRRSFQRVRLPAPA